MTQPLLIGVGNEWRSDDAAGLEVARRLAELDPGYGWWLMGASRSISSTNGRTRTR